MSRGTDVDKGQLPHPHSARADKQGTKGAAKGKAAPKTLKPSRTDENASTDSPDEGRGDVDIAKRLKTVTAERDRYRMQRDEYGQRFEELSKLRTTDAEALFDKYKEKAAVASKAQEDIIAKQTALTAKLQEKIKALEEKLKAAQKTQTADPFEMPVKVEPKDVKALRDRVAKAEEDVKAKDSRISALERDLRTETENSRSLLASRGGAASSTTTSSASEESIKDSMSLRLYEDITEMSIVNVKIIEVPKNGKECTVNCIITRNGKSLNYKMRLFNHLDNAKVKAKDPNPWVKMVHYIPEGLAKESETFVSQLGHFASEFTIPRDQVASMFEELRDSLDAPF